MKLFKLPFTQKYDMYHLLGDDNILILKSSQFDKINTLRASMTRNNHSMFKELPANAKRDLMFYNDSSEYRQTIPVDDKQIQRWIDNGYTVK